VAEAQPRASGRRALVTGASSGIGAATARLLVEAGARVCLVARSSERLTRAAEQLAPGAVAFAADVRDPNQVREALREAIEALDGLDIVVNCAGVAHPASLADSSDQLWRDAIDTNLSGSFYVSRDAGSWMVKHEGGTIVNVASELSTMGMPLYVAYCAAKAGVIGLTKALAAELAPTVTVNAVCPGPVDTPMLHQEFLELGDPEVAMTATLQRVPLRRLATADEVAAAIMFVALDAPYATGATVELDGGTTAVA
jgi:NAD(P)-dependent dehydrogenase (short-subunit alcohol dehydrogenase family)